MILGATDVTLRRYAAPSRGVDGRVALAAPTETTISASVQPLNGRELALLPEGVRARDRRKAYSETELRTADQEAGTVADELVVAGVVYQVQKVQRHSALLPHYRAELARVQESA